MSGAPRRGASFFSRDLGAGERSEHGRLADHTPGVVSEPLGDLGQRQIVLGVEVGGDPGVVVVREEPPRAVALGGRLDRAGVAVAPEPFLDGPETDVEAAGDLGLGVAAGERGSDDTASEVEREGSGQGRSGMVSPLKPPSYSMVALISKPKFLPSVLYRRENRPSWLV